MSIKKLTFLPSEVTQDSSVVMRCLLCGATKNPGPLQSSSVKTIMCSGLPFPFGAGDNPFSNGLASHKEGKAHGFFPGEGTPRSWLSGTLSVIMTWLAALTASPLGNSGVPYLGISVFPLGDLEAARASNSNCYQLSLPLGLSGLTLGAFIPFCLVMVTVNREGSFQ